MTLSKKLYGLRYLLLISSLCISGVAWANHMPVSSMPKAPAAVTQFIQGLWRSNPQIQSMQAELEQAGANAQASDQPIYNPDLNLEGERVHKDEQEDTYTVGISQSIDWSGKRHARASVGQANLQTARAQLAATRLTVSVQALKALANYQSQKTIVATVKRQAGILKQFDEQTRRKFKSGDIAQDALDQANLAYAEVISQLGEAEAQLSEDKAHLQALTNSAPSQWPSLPVQLPKAILANQAEMERWIMQLPTMRVLTSQEQSSQAGIKVAQTETRPDPTLQLKGGEEDHQASVGVGISIPLFVRNNYQAQVLAASAQATAIAQLRLNQYRESKAALEGSMARYGELRRAYLEWKQVSQHSLNGGMALLDKLWSAGELSATDYLVQVKQRLDSAIAGQNLLGNAWGAWFKQLQASGRLNDWFQLTNKESQL